MTEGKHIVVAVSVMAVALLVLGGLPGCAPCGFLPIPGVGAEIEFWAEPDVVPPGGCAMLRWRVISGAEYPTFLNGREVPPEGEEEVCLEEPTTYELVAGAGGESVTRSVTVQVEGMFEEPLREEPGPGEPPPEEPGPEGGPEHVMLVVEPDVIPQGGCAMLRWEVAPPEWPVFINGEEVPPFGEREECPEGTVVYELLVEAPGGPQERAVTLHVEGGGPAPEPTPQQPAPPAATATQPPPVQPTATQQPPPAQPTATTQPAATGADVRPSDLYPDKQPQGNIWVRVVNNGPATLTNKKVRISGQVTQSTKTSPPSASGHNILPQEYTVNLAPGQQQNINLGWQIDLNQYNYEFTVTVEAVGFTDPNSGNNTYKESFSAAATTQATLVVKNSGTANICYVHFVLSPAGANGNWGGAQPMGTSCIFPGKTYLWDLFVG